MANHKPGKNHEAQCQRILFVSAKSFLSLGYTNTTIRDIAAQSGLSSGSVTNLFGTKEDILCGLVKLVIDRQFDVTTLLLKNTPGMEKGDKILFYAAETVLQLYIVEMDKNLREIYCEAYSLPKPSALVRENVAGRMQEVFQEQLPELDARDFYKLEIASGGVMRGFMAVPCSIWFTMEDKVRAFLESALRIYQVPEEKIREAVSFVQTIDFESLARETVDGLVHFLDEKQQEILPLWEMKKEDSI
ncbi:MAG: TetR/AcrR family transcriptional regulator [Clostridiales bacterium]|nr:TetR/AcrR family transcriptional regulator [Clostridiales bacterium]